MRTFNTELISMWMPSPPTKEHLLDLNIEEELYGKIQENIHEWLDLTHCLISPLIEMQIRLMNLWYPPDFKSLPVIKVVTE